uniref:Uncharacterized protein LOC100176231 n=1 Tax=Phallusia mammillata TaxID=59560 RepID=A0A6F9DH26_9ASCI|nr:uncharacterized protein LOC100176231 [Phallusia mammillata]
MSRQNNQVTSPRTRGPLLRHNSEQILRTSQQRTHQEIPVPRSQRLHSISAFDDSTSISLPSSADAEHEPVFPFSPPISGRGVNCENVASIHAGDVVNNHYYQQQADDQHLSYLHHSAGASSHSMENNSSVQRDPAVRKFRSGAMTLAQEACGECQAPIGLDSPLDKVKLELTSEQDRISSNDTTFGRQRRSNFQMAIAPRGNVTIEEIFTLSQNNARKEAESSTMTPQSRSKYIMEHGNRVLVTGQAGIGKSTLSRKFVQMILDQEILPDTKIVCYIYIRDIDCNEELTLVEFLLKYGVSDGEEFSDEEKEFILHEIKKNPNIVLVFDGLDEANSEDIAISPVPKVGMKDKVKVSVLLRSILSGKLLAEAKVLVTCRPRQAFDLSPDYRPGAVIRILGLDASSQKQLGQQICGNDCGRVYGILHEDPDLETACYVPVFCIILYAVLLRNPRRTESGNPSLNTITRVMIFLLNIYLRSAHMRHIDVRELTKIACLARNMFANKKGVFKQYDIQSVGLTQKGYQAFMVTYLDRNTKLKLRIFEGEHNCSFSHMIWQEFFTALDLMFFASNDEFDHYERHLMDDPRWEVVAKFMYGLTNVNNMNDFKQNFTAFQKFETNWDKRRGILKTSTEVRFQQGPLDSYITLQLFNQVREADDSSFTLRVAKRGLPQTLKLDSVDGNPLTVFSSDVRSLMRLLQTAAEYLEENSVKEIDMEQVMFSGDSFVRFANGISIIRKKIQGIRLVECWLGCAGTSSLTKLLPKFERIHLAYCDISNEQINALYGHYCSMPSPRPEVWVFGRDGVARDFGFELKQKKSQFDPETEDTFAKSKSR